MAYGIMRFEKIKSMGSFMNKFKHNFRIGNVPNADKERAHLNETLITMPDENYTEAFRRIMYENKHTPRANAVLGIEVMMTYNANEVDGDFDVEKWSKANIEWLEKEFGKENVVSAVLHRDEGPTKENTKNGAESGHIHAIVIPMVDGKLNAKHFISGRGKLHEMQTRYGEAMEPLGLERGIEGSVAKHEKVQKMYAAINKTFDDNLPSPEPGEKIEDYAERVNDIYIERNLKHLQELKKAERKVVEETSKGGVSLEDKLTLQNNISELDKMRRKIRADEDALKKEKEEFEAYSKDEKVTVAKAKQYDTIMKGLKELPDREYAKQIAEGINKAVQYAVGDNDKKNTKER